MAWLSAKAIKVGGSVDREKNALMGYVVAQEGPFKSDGRGEFDLKGLKQLAAIMNKNPGGTKSRLAHPTMSDDGVGKFLGRAKNARVDSVRLNRDGETVLLHCVRADLYFNPTALDTPIGGGKPLGQYIMDLCESDPDAISSSVVIDPDVVEQLDAKGRPVLDANGNAKPPLWYPLAIHASDIVDTGDAVDGLLSAGIDIGALPDGIARQGFEMLKTQFAGKSREFAQQHLLAWMDRALNHVYGLSDTGGMPLYDVGDRVMNLETGTVGEVRGAHLGWTYSVLNDGETDTVMACEEELIQEQSVEDGEEEAPLGMSADVARLKLQLAERGESK